MEARDFFSHTKVRWIDDFRTDNIQSMFAGRAGMQFSEALVRLGYYYFLIVLCFCFILKGKEKLDSADVNADVMDY